MEGFRRVGRSLAGWLCAADRHGLERRLAGHGRRAMRAVRESGTAALIGAAFLLFVHQVVAHYQASTAADVQAQANAPAAASLLSVRATPARTAPVAGAMSQHERSLRRALVRSAVLELDGVASSGWLPDGTLLLRTSAAPHEAVHAACTILGRYPELGVSVAVQGLHARARPEGHVQRYRCGAGRHG